MTACFKKPMTFCPCCFNVETIVARRCAKVIPRSVLLPCETYFPNDRFDLRQLDLSPHTRIANARARQSMTTTPTGGGQLTIIRHTLRRECLTPVACMSLSTTTSIRAPSMNRSWWIRRWGQWLFLELLANTACSSLPNASSCATRA